MIRSSLQDSIYDASAGSGLAARVALSHWYTARVPALLHVSRRATGTPQAR